MSKLYLGLDLGSDSVGWALTDENYKLERAKGKDTWGVRIFEEAEPCQDRRLFRSVRRRQERRKNRIKFLQMIMAEEVKKRDESFFKRLNESSLHLEDKSLRVRHPLFIESRLEKEYYKEFPTIWHLRKSLIECDKDYSDIRKVYLALHHIIKYRGNFLKEGQIINERFDEETFRVINEEIDSCFQIEEQVIYFSENEQLLNVLVDEKTQLSEKKKLLSNYIHSDDKNIVDLVRSLMLGSSYSFKKILDCDSDTTIEFRKDDDNKFQDTVGKVGDFGNLVKALKSVYDFVHIRKLLSFSEDGFLSSSMVNIFNEHKRSLEELKSELIKVDNDLNLKGEDRYYYAMFKKTGVPNYQSFVHSHGKKRCERRQEKRCSIYDFNNYAAKLIEEIAQKTELSGKLQKVLDQCEERKFLTTIALNSTSAIPYQLHEKELKRILEKVNKYYPSIETKKIEQIFKFKIPYYVGPLNPNSPFSNIVKKEDVKITPWNFSSVVDFEATRNKFMSSRTNKCQYLFGEDVLPRSSLLYQEYDVLDKINCIKIDGNLIDLKTRDVIFSLCKERNEVTKKAIIDRLYSNGIVKDKDISISGIDDKMTSSLTSYVYFHKNLGLDVEKNEKFIEKAIDLATIYVDDTRPAQDILSALYPGIGKADIEKALRVPTRSYGAFSRKFLDEVSYISDDGVFHSIISCLRENVLNLNQILDKEEFGFQELIRRENSSGTRDVVDLIKEKMDGIPPVVRRSVNQSLLIIDELIGVKKATKIDKIFIEVTREEKKKERSTARRDAIKNFYSSLAKDKEYADSVDCLKKELDTIDDSKLNSTAVYLYFMQLGFDLYTGKKISSLQDVLSSDKYDIDHIIPRSIYKDDSLDNKVLVSRYLNQNVKKNYYPIPVSIRTDPSCVKLWKYLKKREMISDKKYSSLMRADSLTEDELNSFINRQLTVLNYSNTCLRDILHLRYPQTAVVFSKAAFVSVFRKKFNIVKNRSTNDLHHAVDAYLNVVVGDVIDKTFTINRADIVKRVELEIGSEKKSTDRIHTLNFMQVFFSPFNAYWDKNLEERVIKTAWKRSMLHTFKPYTETGALYNQTICKAGSSSITGVLHTKSQLKNTAKYGGYTNLHNAFFSIIEYKKQGKTIKQIYSFPLIDYLESKRTGKSLDSFIKRRLEIDGLKIIKSKVLMSSKIRLGVSRVLITGETGTRICLKLQESLILSQKSELLIKKLDRFKDRIADEFDGEKISFVVNNKNEEVEISKNENLELFKEIVGQRSRKKYRSLNNLVQTLERVCSAQAAFEKLTIKSQIEFIFELLVLLDNSRTLSDLRLLNENGDNCFKKNSGVLLMSSDLNDKAVALIDESITGLFCREERL